MEKKRLKQEQRDRLRGDNNFHVLERKTVCVCVCV